MTQTPAANRVVTTAVLCSALTALTACSREVVRTERWKDLIVEADPLTGVATDKLLHFRRDGSTLVVQLPDNRSGSFSTSKGASLALSVGDSFTYRTFINGEDSWRLVGLTDTTAKFDVHGGGMGCTTDKWGRFHGLVYDQRVELRFHEPASAATANATWWFPFFTPTGTQQSFDIVVSDDVTINEHTRNITDRARLTVDLLPAPDQGCIVQIVRPEDLADNDERQQNQILHWIQGWSERNPDGLAVTPDRLLVRGADVLQGPWHKGDRFTIGGFGAIFFVFYLQAVGFSHWEVTNVSATGADLHVEFWFGESGPAVRGSGDASFRNDANGLTRIDATWRRSDGRETHNVKLTAERSAIRTHTP